jgi:aminocarboxymuconate-semialdehyde decarboxylase
MRTIDLHAHLTPHCLLESLRTGTPLHGIDANSIARGLGRDITIDDRLAHMDRIGVDVQVVSSEPQMYGYDLPVDTAAAIGRDCNDEIGDMISSRPDRFTGLAILPMQDLPRAIAEMERAMTSLRFAGVMIGDHVNGQLYDEPQFRPFWGAAQELGALVLLHQASPTLVASRVTRYHLPNTIGNAVERTIGSASIIFGGVLDEFPALNVCLCHGGGYTCFAAGRLDWGWQWRATARQHIARPPSEYLTRFFYDCITHSESALRYVIDTVGIDRVVFGSDYPGFAAGAEGAHYDPKAWLVGLASLTDDEKQAILGGNAERLLALA